jgi:hypothetical protein
VIRTVDATQKGHAVLGCTVAGTHDLAPTTRRGRTIDRSNTARSIFSTVVCDIQPYDRRLRAWWSALDQNNFRNTAILAEIIVRAQGRYQLGNKGEMEIEINDNKWHTSSLAKRGPIPTTYTTLRCTTLTLARLRRPSASRSFRSRSRCFFCWAKRRWL